MKKIIIRYFILSEKHFVQSNSLFLVFYISQDDMPKPGQPGQPGQAPRPAGGAPAART
jgi:hypothetical protein